MTIIDVINAANVLADESIDFNEMVTFFNRSISKINMEAGLLFPIAKKGDGGVNQGNLEDEYYIMREATFADPNNKTPEELARESQLESANQMFLDMIVIQYIHYAIKVQDATEYEWRSSYDEWNRNMKEFIARWKQLINPIYLSQNMDIDGNGKKLENGFGIYPIENGPYAEVNAWGQRPTAGSGNTTGPSGRATSKNPFGIGVK